MEAALGKEQLGRPFPQQDLSSSSLLDKEPHLVGRYQVLVLDGDREGEQDREKEG